MFGFFRKRRQLQEARTKIGIDLHRQVRDALWSNDKVASERLSSSFTPGYIYYFALHAFNCLGFDGANVVNSELRKICDGVLPKKLYRIFSNQLAALEIAKRMKNQDTEILNTGMSPADVVRQFWLGAEAAEYDAPLVSLEAVQADNLRRFLLGEELKL